MGKKAIKSKIVKSLALATLSTSFILGSIGPVPKVTKAFTFSAENTLASLTAEQRAALNQLSTNETSGLQLSADTDLNSTKHTTVIVEFANKPAKVARMLASVEGKQLSDEDATNLVQKDHDTFIQDLGQILTDDQNQAVDYKIKHSYKTAFNGVSMELPANQIKNLLKSKAVKSVWSNETFSIDPPPQDSVQLKADEANVANFMPYDGLDRLHAEGYTGKGIKVGILDTGMDYHHPDLADAYKGGYDFVNNDNDPMETTYADWKKSGKAEISNGNAYYTEHGTHVAGIIGGRGVSDSEYSSLGAAPEADLYAYRVLGPYGSGMTDAIIAGLDRAVQDGMDVLNLSLGNTLNDPLYATSIAVNNAVLSGVTTVVAAGNSGDRNYTLGSPGAAALALTVGASTISLDVYQYSGVQNGNNYSLRQLARNYSDDLSQLKGKSVQLVDVGLARTAADFNGKDLNGKFAVIKRGTNALIDKIKNAKARGAIGVLMYNDETNSAEGPIQSFLGESIDAIPAFSVSNADGKAILAAINAGDASFTFGDYTKVKTPGDELAAFSSRGPSRVNYDIKPEVTAPGVSIMSTVPFYINNKNVDGTHTEDYQYAFQRLSGTSMATPYVAGVSALLLQSNKNLDPADIKSILMNTADPLSKDYSVFEIGSGRVDAYEAIHSNVEIQVDDRTPMVKNKNEKSVRELTGGISFGTFGFDNQDITDERNVMLKNRSEKSKTFDVNVKFQTGLRGSKDAALNNVTLDGPSFVNIEGNSQRVIKFNLSIPKTAEKGTYEGYIVFTNKEDPTETYQIPFGSRVVNEGIDTLTIANPMYSGDISIPDRALPAQSFNFSLKSHMKNIDVVVQDAKTGEDVGLIGTLDGRLIDENLVYGITTGFSGAYFPFTGDPKKPISDSIVLAKTGHYKLKMIGTNDQGKTFSKSADFIYEKGAPTMTSSFDSLDQKVIEYKDSQFDSNGQFLYDFNINVNDPEVDEANRAGIPIDQSSNQVVPYNNEGWPELPRNTDKNGNYKDQILVPKGKIPYKISFYANDAARNFTSNHTAKLRVVFVPETYSYYYLKANKQTASTGDTINYSLRSNNMKNLKTAKIIVPVLKVDNKDLATIKNVVVSDAVKKYGDAQVTVTSTDTTNVKTYTITFNYLGNESLPEDMQLVNFDLVTANRYWKDFPANWWDMQFTATTIDQSNVVKNNVYTYMEAFDLKQTHYSRLEGQMRLEGAIDPKTGQTNWALDQQNIGAKVTVTSYDGKNVVDAFFINKNGNYVADELNADPKPYTIKVDVPGHFTMYKSLVISDEVRGETLGRRLGFSLTQAKAGDVNKDNVIDILDAIEIQNNWGTNKLGSDLNFDKVVDKKDMDFVVKNFGLQNTTVSDAPKAKSSYKGITLDDVLTKLGLK
ncbi:S8 family serine peptidase [Neobacillus bataviensis]|uniref:S8 family serine peptidase n=1 Tax=Neobacillus bataviensis TaxID=220685 RepID=UPI002958D77A|nr:S8 family serine peptidase [Neobacillus bataviensis]